MPPTLQDIPAGEFMVREGPRDEETQYLLLAKDRHEEIAKTQVRSAKGPLVLPGPLDASGQVAAPGVGLVVFLLHLIQGNAPNAPVQGPPFAGKGRPDQGAIQVHIEMDDLVERVEALERVEEIRGGGLQGWGFHTPKCTTFLERV